MCIGIGFLLLLGTSEKIYFRIPVTKKKQKIYTNVCLQKYDKSYVCEKKYGVCAWGNGVFFFSLKYIQMWYVKCECECRPVNVNTNYGELCLMCYVCKTKKHSILENWYAVKP